MTAMRSQADAHRHAPSPDTDEVLVSVLADLSLNPVRMSCALTGLASMIIGSVPDKTLDPLIEEWVRHYVKLAAEMNG